MLARKNVEFWNWYRKLFTEQSRQAWKKEKRKEKIRFSSKFLVNIRVLHVSFLYHHKSVSRIHATKTSSKKQKKNTIIILCIFHKLEHLNHKKIPNKKTRIKTLLSNLSSHYVKQKHNNILFSFCYRWRSQKYKSANQRDQGIRCDGLSRAKKHSYIIKLKKKKSERKRAFFFCPFCSDLALGSGQKFVCAHIRARMADHNGRTFKYQHGKKKR